MFRRKRKTWRQDCADLRRTEIEIRVNGDLILGPITLSHLRAIYKYAAGSDMWRDDEMIITNYPYVTVRLRRGRE